MCIRDSIKVALCIECADKIAAVFENSPYLVKNFCSVLPEINGVHSVNSIYVPDIPNLVGKSSGEADRQREYQRRKKEDAISCEKMR